MKVCGKNPHRFCCVISVRNVRSSRPDCSGDSESRNVSFGSYHRVLQRRSVDGGHSVAHYRNCSVRCAVSRRNGNHSVPNRSSLRPFDNHSFRHVCGNVSGYCESGVRSSRRSSRHCSPESSAGGRGSLPSGSSPGSSRKYLPRSRSGCRTYAYCSSCALQRFRVTSGVLVKRGERTVRQVSGSRGSECRSRKRRTRESFVR